MRIYGTSSRKPEAAPRRRRRARTSRSWRLILSVAVLALAIATAIGSGIPSAGADEACPNEAIRIRQHATQTADCRAWEKVTPAEKGGSDIAAGGEPTELAAPNGNAAIFESLTGFGGSEGSGANGRNAYLSRRSSSGWTTSPITPHSNPDANLVFQTGTYLFTFSDDLSRAFVRAYDLPGVTDDTPERINFYQEDTATRAVHSITGSQTGEGDPIPYSIVEFGGQEITWGSSNDLAHISFPSKAQLVPAVPGEYPNGAPNAYTWDEGKLHLAGILPDGTIPPGGSTIEQGNYKGSMSASGSRQVFSSPAFGTRQLYLRIDHNSTDLVSESENAAFTEEPLEVHFEGMTPDGNHVFFTTESPLLAADDSPGPDLYRWTYGPDPEHESNLTLITDTGSAAADDGAGRGGSLVGMSDDGQTVYVHERSSDLSVWNDGVRILIDNFGTAPYRTLWLGQSNPGLARVSPDGDWLAYIKEGGGSPMYLYNLAENRLSCASCPGGFPPQSDKPFGLLETANATGGFPGYRLRYLSDDGQVYFTTETSLVPEDNNGVADVYAYDGSTGRRSLISSGTGSGASEFVDASKSGDDVFFVTRNQLVPSDTDEYVDLYDARVGGGFDEPETSSNSTCAGEACQGFGGGLVPSPAIASRVSGHGNVKPRHRCPRGQHRVRRHPKGRCVKRHPRHHADHRRGQRIAQRGIAR